jgi:hypothetical protein
VTATRDVCIYCLILDQRVRTWHIQGNARSVALQEEPVSKQNQFSTSILSFKGIYYLRLARRQSRSLLVKSVFSLTSDKSQSKPKSQTADQRTDLDHRRVDSILRIFRIVLGFRIFVHAVCFEHISLSLEHESAI